MNSSTKIIFKFIISSVLLYFIFKNIEFSEFTSYFRFIPAQIIFISIILAIIIKVIESIRWKLLLDNNKTKFKFSKLFSINMVGGFFNIFFPSTIGGDAMRIVYIKNKNISLLTATKTVLFGRLIGLFSIFIISIISVVFGWNFVIAEIRIPVLAISGMGVLIMTTVYFFFNRFLYFMDSITARYSNRITLKINSFVKLLDYSKYSNKLILICFYLSIMIYLIGVSVIILIGNSLLVEKIDILYYLIIIPLITVITVLPISIGGFGVREGLFALFLAPLGINLEQSTLLSLLSFSPFVIVGLLGGLFYLFGSNSCKEAANV